MNASMRDQPPAAREDVDPSRSMEAAPVGLQRVEDYGAHERRELQANVFAREFLFPRSLARRMFVDQGLSGVRYRQSSSICRCRSSASKSWM